MFKKRSGRPRDDLRRLSESQLTELLRIQREYDLKALKRTAPTFRICMTCRGLLETTPSASQPLQRCGCDRGLHRDEWKGDLAERAHLCECCRMELLLSGSRFSVWFCPECNGRVRELNALVGRCVIPIGRHSLMAGIGVPGQALIDADPQEFSAITETLRVNALGWLDSMNRLHAFSADRIGVMARRVGLEGLPAIPLDEWFERFEALSDPSFDKPGAFRALVDWFTLSSSQEGADR